jgi:cell division protein FtsB
VETLLLEPVVQYGFLGFSMALLGVIVWLIQKLLAVLDKNNRVIAANTEAIRSLGKVTDDLLQTNRSLYDKVITRPCIASLET